MEPVQEAVRGLGVGVGVPESVSVLDAEVVGLPEARLGVGLTEGVAEDSVRVGVGARLLVRDPVALEVGVWLGVADAVADDTVPLKEGEGDADADVEREGVEAEREPVASEPEGEQVVMDREAEAVAVGVAWKVGLQVAVYEREVVVVWLRDSVRLRAWDLVRVAVGVSVRSREQVRVWEWDGVPVRLWLGLEDGLPDRVRGGVRDPDTDRELECVSVSGGELVRLVVKDRETVAESGAVAVAVTVWVRVRVRDPAVSVSSKDCEAVMDKLRVAEWDWENGFVRVEVGLRLAEYEDGVAVRDLPDGVRSRVPVAVGVGDPDGLQVRVADSVPDGADAVPDLVEAEGETGVTESVRVGVARSEAVAVHVRRREPDHDAEGLVLSVREDPDGDTERKDGDRELDGLQEPVRVHDDRLRVQVAEPVRPVEAVRDAVLVAVSATGTLAVSVQVRVLDGSGVGLPEHVRVSAGVRDGVQVSVLLMERDVVRVGDSERVGDRPEDAVALGVWVAVRQEDGVPVSVADGKRERVSVALCVRYSDGLYDGEEDGVEV